MKIRISFLILALAGRGLAGCGGSSGNITFACDNLGLTSVQYQGVEYFDPAGWARSAPITFGANFSDGTKVSSGGWKGSSDTASTTILYGKSAPYSFSIRFDYSIPDDNTLQVHVTVSNLHPAAALQGLQSLVVASLAIPKPYTVKFDGTGLPLSGAIGPYVTTSGQSIAFFSPNLLSGWFATRASLYTNQPDSSHDRWNLGLANSQANGPVVLATPVAPGSTQEVDVFLRFGSTDADPSAMLAEALAAIRTGAPPQINWPDRRPIATWFLSDYGHASPSNPRGWFNDPSCNCTDQPTFRFNLQATLARLLKILNQQPVKPQGVVLWDMEGQEFPQVMTYVGNPPLLNALAPEMDAEIDAVMATLTANGYQVGMTLRPNYIPAGDTLPGSCQFSSNTDYNQRFLLTTGTPRGRYYLCNSSGAFVNFGGIGNQMSYQDVASVLNELSQKVTYANQRWGATLFYVDSVVWSGGAPFVYTIWQQLSQQFPNFLFMPEEKTAMHYGFSAPYSDAHQGRFWNTSSQRFVYPGAFGVINLGNATPTEIPAGTATVSGNVLTLASGPNFGSWAGQTIYLNALPFKIASMTSTTKLVLSANPSTDLNAGPIPVTWRAGTLTGNVVSGMSNGDIYMYPGWYTSWYLPSISAMYEEANYRVVVADTSGSGGSCTLRSYGGNPGSAYAVPLTMTVTFAATPDGLASNPVSCAVGSSCQMDLSQMAYYQLSYFDQGGNLVNQSQPASTTAGTICASQN